VWELWTGFADEPEVLLEMYQVLLAGKSIVYARRRSRTRDKSETFFLLRFLPALPSLADSPVQVDSGDC